MISEGDLSKSGLVKLRTACRGCLSRALERRVPLAPLPIASPNVGRPGVTALAPADLFQCNDCGLLQLTTIVDPVFQYREFRYTTGISAGLRAHFADLVSSLAYRGEIKANTLALDIGSNDGSLLRLLRDRGARVLGVDPAIAIAEAATQSGIPTIGDFFTSSLGKRIEIEHGAASLVVSANTVANIDDLDDFFNGARSVLAPDGLMIIETQYALDVIEKLLIDVIYHEHVSYFSVRPFRSFLERVGFELVDAERISPKGGSIRFYIQRSNGGRKPSSRVGELIAAETASGLYDMARYQAFSTDISALAAKARQHMVHARRASGRALAYGSSVGCAALIQYFGLGSHIDAIFDDSPLVSFIGTPDGSIPVLSGVQLEDETATDVLVLAWRYAELIAAKHRRFRRGGGRFYKVLPDIVPVTPIA